LRSTIVSKAWLSDDMACVLAAMCPPLDPTDVSQAADKLTARTRAPLVIDQLLRRGVDLLKSRLVVEALCALRDACETDSDLAGWLLAKETGVDLDAQRLADGAERVCGKLFGRLSRLISSTGCQGILSRALHSACRGFPFLEGVGAGTVPGLYLAGLAERVHDRETGDAGRGLLAVLDAVLDLLFQLIGEDLTSRLLREVWPDAPLPVHGHHVRPIHVASATSP
jgi:hypothetical protein